MRVLLGVTGGIAAYKAASLVRCLQTRGHEVRCAMTRHADAFVTPLTLEVLSGHGVYREEYLEATGSGEELHIEAAAWAEVLCVLPATANVLAKLARGFADDFLTTTALAFEGSLVLAPAMHSVMWSHPAVRENVEILKKRRALFVGPERGALASGEVGEGRLAEPEVVASSIGRLGVARSLAGRRVLVSAGPTREPIDPVRFLSNRSSGRMGFALAAEAARRGADTCLVAGPVELETPHGVRRIDVVTAAGMRREVEAAAPGCDLIVMAAAVGDFRPAYREARKVKKDRFGDRLALTTNPDILRSLADAAPDALRVGFAAETDDLEAEARRKLGEKQAHFIVVNDVSRADVGFESSDNEVTVYGREGPPTRIPKRPKEALAGDLLTLFEAALREEAASPAVSLPPSG